MVCAVCTDNESKRKQVKMRLNVKDARPELVTYGCSSYYVNLLEMKLLNEQL